MMSAWNKRRSDDEEVGTGSIGVFADAEEEGEGEGGEKRKLLEEEGFDFEGEDEN